MKNFTTSQKLQLILVRLNEVEHQDTETRHVDADDLLIETIQILGRNRPETEKIIAKYKEFPKWYA